MQHTPDEGRGKLDAGDYVLNALQRLGAIAPGEQVAPVGELAEFFGTTRGEMKWLLARPLYRLVRYAVGPPKRWVVADVQRELRSLRPLLDARRHWRDTNVAKQAAEHAAKIAAKAKRKAERGARRAKPPIARPRPSRPAPEVFIARRAPAPRKKP